MKLLSILQAMVGGFPNVKKSSNVVWILPKVPPVRIQDTVYVDGAASRNGEKYIL